MNNLLALSRKYSDSCFLRMPFWRQQIIHFSLLLFTLYYGESNEGRMADALAHGGDEGRDKLR